MHFTEVAIATYLQAFRVGLVAHERLGARHCHPCETGDLQSRPAPTLARTDVEPSRLSHAWTFVRQGSRTAAGHEPASTASRRLRLRSGKGHGRSSRVESELRPYQSHGSSTSLQVGPWTGPQLALDDVRRPSSRRTGVRRRALGNRHRTAEQRHLGPARRSPADRTVQQASPCASDSCSARCTRCKSQGAHHSARSLVDAERLDKHAAWRAERTGRSRPGRLPDDDGRRFRRHRQRARGGGGARQRTSVGHLAARPARAAATPAGRAARAVRPSELRADTPRMPRRWQTGPGIRPRSVRSRS